MAMRNSECEIETISSHSESDAQKKVMEATPLVVRKYKGRNSLLQRLCESILIKSKAVNIILFWNTLVCLLYGSLPLINPENVFVLLAGKLLRRFVYSQTLFNATEGSITFMNMIGSVVYGVIAVWLLFYPLAGYLADVRYGRYKVVISGLKVIWFGSLIYFVGNIFLLAILSVFFFLPQNPAALWILQSTAFLAGCIASSTGLIIITYFLVSVGFAAYAANVIQFSIDQLQDLPARNGFLLVYWFLLTSYIGVSIGKLAFSAILSTFLVLSVVLTLTWLLVLIALPISLCVAKPRWFVIEPGIGNPYKEVAQVVDFARKHKVPIQRSAFTYWEDNIPTGLDLGKCKYGGPFTTDQVENVKAFFGILYILLSLGPFFTSDIAASVFLPLLKHHMDNWVSYSSFDIQYIIYSMITNGGTMYPIFMIILIPIFLKVIHPLFQRYILTILKRIGIGLCLITVSLLCSLLVDTMGHVLPNGHNATSIFNPGNIIEDPPSLQLSPYILFIQNFLIAVAYILIYGGVFEFICAQSPHSMKGVLIGIFFAVKGLFQLIGVLGILLPFSFWQTSPRAGLVYFLVNIVISIVGVVAFMVIARRYQYRQRDDFCNIRKYIEDFYEKEVQHNPRFEELHANFSD